MIQDPEPLLHPREISSLRPTQITVGLREVERKQQEWRHRAEREGPDFLGRHMLPVVIGPKDRAYLIDNHHLALALHREGVKHVLVHVIADLSMLARPAFITFMDNRNWLHPFDAKGVRQDYDDIPKQVAGLADDPYRSLAGALRRAGGYAKVDTPYAEFLWADFLRRRIKPARVDDHFDKALSDALAFANSRDTAHLPGWSGISD
ncbi:MAG: ParB-like protein [Pseudomonadota bacterium]|uniref:ParB-like protein n=1 Tax=Sphingomonas sp. ERG5 TaxID=1381597 RepID=UPI00054B5E0A|nr:ParB-like protein [Sphingomonas sp. ERG5]